MKPKSKDTVVTLANAIEVVIGVVHEVSGKDVANTLNGDKLSRAALSNLVASRVHARFAKHVNKAVN